MRKAIVTTTITIMFVSVLATICTLVSADPGPESSWPMFHATADRQGRTTNIGPTTASLAWKIYIGGPMGNYGPVIGHNGIIYMSTIGNFTPPWGGPLYAFCPNGAITWSFFGGGFTIAPAISNVGIIYIGSLDGKLYALNPNGTEAWSYQTGGEIWSSPAIANDGTIVFGSDDNKVYALNSNGTLKWSYQTGGWVETPAISADGTIYAGCWDGKLYSISPTGSFKWSYQTGGMIDAAPAVASDGTVFFGSGDNNTYALNPNGTLKWMYPTGDQVRSSPAIGWDGTVYVGSDDNYLYAINGTNGSLKWQYETAGIVRGGPAIDGHGNVYFGSDDAYIYALTSDGDLRWSFKRALGDGGSVAIGENKIVYFGSDDGYLYAVTDMVELPTITSITPDHGKQGETLDVIITGTNSAGATEVSFGAGITVNSFDVGSSAQITADITIDNNAAIGGTDVALTTPSGTANLPDGFTVEKKGGCFIATAAYGTPMAPQIDVLREFRDQYLLTNPVGQALVDLYYRVSPPMAEFITEHPSLKPVVRAGLVPAVVMSTVVVNTTPAEKMVIVGFLVLVSVALAVWATRRRGRCPQYT